MRRAAQTGEPTRAAREVSTRPEHAAQVARRRGAARASLLFGAAVVCAALVAALVLVLRAPAPQPSRPTERGSSPPVEAPTLELAHGPVADRTRASSLPHAPLTASSFEGRGALRGEVVTQNGAPLPSDWTLVLEPSPVLAGRERAQTRRIARTAAQTTFEVEDLPLAGYRVRAELPTLNGRPIDVLLVASSPEAYVTLALAPAGLIDGIVMKADGAPADEFEVTLEERVPGAAPGIGGARRSVRTDVNGAYVLRDVLDGEYWLHFGPPDAPLAPKADILFVAPTLRVPTRTLPPVGALHVEVFDSTLRPVPDVRLAGSCAGGAFDLRTDAHGAIDAQYLIPGTWRVEVTHPRHAARRHSFEVNAGETTTSQVRLVD